MRCRSPTNFMRWQHKSVQFEAPQFLSWKIPSSDQQCDTTLGRSRGGLSTKIHACVEGLGQLARFILTAGQVHDVTQAQALLETVVPAAVLADKAYDANALLACIANKQAKAVIPPKTTRKLQRQFDRHQYRNRNVIERFFARIKQFRRVATRYDKLASRFASFVALTASLLWLQ